MSKTVSFKLNYNSTDKTRLITLDNVLDEVATPNTVRTKVNTINASLTSGTADELASIFVSDDYDSTLNIGTLKKITDVEIKTVIEIPITA
ncbi:MAG: hypothetical protein IJG33_08820 [Selenomonadaceae bacterium]|nr:hypothetical protein [Bacteroidaceae bacterium]MBQ3443333.1 hypothetical protein [Selenomonadaceae bacterium]MBQ6004616.1 hypothetical protein [Selenomonadaceae bacterium]